MNLLVTGGYGFIASNFINNMINDSKTKFFYFGFGGIMLIEIIFYHTGYFNIWIDIGIIIIIILSLYFYWRHILNFINPKNVIAKINIKNWGRGKETPKEIQEIGDYVKIGIHSNNDMLTNKSFNKLIEFNERLKND